MKILIVIDMQNDFVYNKLGTLEAQAIIPNILDKCAEYDNKFIIFTKDTHKDNYLSTQEGKFLPIAHCLADTEGWDIVNQLRTYARRGKASIIEKDTFGSFTIINKIRELFDEEEIESIELCGVCTDICVITNALLLKTRFPETPIYIDANCCAGTTPEKHQAALEVMKSCQIIIKENNND